MARIVSTQVMVEQLEGLLHTRDLTIREADFVAKLVLYRKEGRLGTLSERQVNWMGDLYRRHFA